MSLHAATPRLQQVTRARRIATDVVAPACASEILHYERRAEVRDGVALPNRPMIDGWRIRETTAWFPIYPERTWMA
jgi:hypothetical protein